jgi:hypothetical protein
VFLKVDVEDLVIDSDGILYVNFSKDILEKQTTAMMEIMKTFQS